MQIVDTPGVFLISEPHIDWPSVLDFLETQGSSDGRDASDWLSRVSSVSAPEALVEFAGRLCYKSWVPGINANVTKVREDSQSYIKNILDSKHGAVLEHANLTFVFNDVSRVFCHELVRHRAGVAISQESLRYVRLTDLSVRIPDVLEPARDLFVSVIETLEQVQVQLADEFGLDDKGVPFHVKKEVTSALRRLAPLGLCTRIMWTANFRTLRHVIAQRTAQGAEEEIREVFLKVATICLERYPLVFQDMSINSDGSCSFLSEKV